MIKSVGGAGSSLLWYMVCVYLYVCVSVCVCIPNVIKFSLYIYFVVNYSTSNISLSLFYSLHISVIRNFSETSMQDDTEDTQISQIQARLLLTPPQCKINLLFSHLNLLFYKMQLAAYEPQVKRFYVCLCTLCIPGTAGGQK